MWRRSFGLGFVLALSSLLPAVADAAGPVAALAVQNPMGFPPLQSTFDTSHSQVDDGQTAALHLVFPGNGDVLTQPASGATLAYTYAFPGFYLAGSWLSESPSGLAAGATPAAISVARVGDGQAPPAVDVVVAHTTDPLTMAFMPMVTPADGDAEVARRWDFGDGSFGGEPMPLHGYAQAGLYQAALLSTTGSGMAAAARLIVAVAAADGSMPPSLLVGITPGDAPPLTPVTLVAFISPGAAAGAGATVSPTVKNAHVDWPGLEDAAPGVTTTDTGVMVRSPYAFAAAGVYDVPITVELDGLTTPLSATGHVTVGDLSAMPPSPALLAPPSSSATVGQPYEPSGAGATLRGLLIAGNGPFAFAVVAPSPAGLIVDSTGKVGWTPSAAQLGDQRLAVTVTDGAGQTLALSWVVTVSDVHKQAGCAAIPGAANAGETAWLAALALLALGFRRRRA
jgi:MYXO-CTERM domain-containing protein